MTAQKESAPFESLSQLNDDGSMVTMLAAPFIVIVVVILLIAIFRKIRSHREQADLASSMRE